MVKHSPNERLRLLQQQQQQRAMANQGHVTNDDMPALEDPNTGLPPVSEALRRAAEVRAEAEAQDNIAPDTGFLPHPNVNDRRRRDQGIHLDDDVGDDLGASFVEMTFHRLLHPGSPR